MTNQTDHNVCPECNALGSPEKGIGLSTRLVPYECTNNHCNTTWDVEYVSPTVTEVYTNE